MTALVEKTRDEGEQLAHGAGFRGGVVRAFGVLGAALCVWALPYVVPGLEAYRPWTPSEPLPFVRLFAEGSSGPAVAEVGGGISARSTLAPDERALLASVDKDLERTAPSSPSSSSRAQNGTGTKTSKIVAPSEIAAVKVPITDPHGAMRAFYRALARTARGEKGAITRISHRGDSATAPDKITAITRLLLQKRFGDAGHGFILASPASRWYRIAGVARREGHWKRKRITHGGARDGRYGYGGVRAIGRRKAYARFAISQQRSVGRNVGRFEIYYLRGPRRGELSVLVDGKQSARFSTHAETWQDAVHTIRVPDGNHRLSVRVASGEVSVYGVVLEREVPGVVYDNLGLIGLTAKHLHRANEAHLKGQFAFRKPDLLVVMLGGNTLSRHIWKAERYRKTFARTLRRTRRARPQASCLVLPPLDHGERVAGRIRTKPRLLKMLAVQRQVALAERCAFYDIFAAMGGEGTMGRWAKARPRLVLPDYAHVSRDGARVLGALIYKALLHGFASYRARVEAGGLSR